MKRTIAILLAVLMLAGIVPASLLTATAHGIGVGKNSFNNISIDNAPEQDIVATITVDGKSDDTAWKYEDWNNVGAANGTWSVTVPKNSSFGYKYQLHTDYQYLYGVFVIDTNTLYKGTLGDITVWLNDSDADKYTDKIILTADGTCTVYNFTTVAADNGLDTVNATLSAVTNEDGVYTIEFRTLISNITANESAVLKSYVSVDVNIDGETEHLFYPRFSVDDTDTGMNPAEAWAWNAVEITQWDIAASSHSGSWGAQNGDFSKIVPNEIHVDGELNEGVWENFTNYYHVGENVFEYRDGTTPHSQDGYDFTDLSVGYSDSMYYYGIEDGKVNIPRENANGKMVLEDSVAFNNYSINADVTKDKNQYYYDANYIDFYKSPVKFKYDLRANDKYLFGAVMAYIDSDSEEFYYHIKKYETENPDVADGTVLVVPTYFFVVFDGKSTDAAYTLRVRYNTEVKYDKAADMWKFTAEYGSGKNESTESILMIDGSESVNVSAKASAKRLNRYLITMEFCLSLSGDLNLKDAASGKFWNRSTGAYDADSFSITNTVAMSNTWGMYSRYPGDIAEATGTTTKNIHFYSYGYVDNSGSAVKYKEGDTIQKTKADGTVETITAKQDNTGLWRVSESNFDFSYFNTFDLGYYAYHAWSLGGGMVVSNPVVASNDSEVSDPTGAPINGVLEPELWANLLAADSIINGMGRRHTVDSDANNDDLDAEGKGEASINDGIISSYYHELKMDNEYLYGAAILVDDDGVWKIKNSTNPDFDLFRIWINNQGKVWSESYDSVINFYIDSSLNTSLGAIGVCEVMQNGSIVATSTSANINSAGINDTESQHLNGHGIEVSMRVVDGYQLRDVAKTPDQGGAENGYYSVDLAVLEFRIPLKVLGIQSQEYNAEAFLYATSLEYYSGSGSYGGTGLCWPLLDNSNIKSDEYFSTNTYYEDVMYFDPWNCHNRDSATILLNDRSAATITVDGNHAEEIWNNEEERIKVDTTTGTWDVMPLGKDIFDYQYKVYTGRDYVYGMAEINAIANDSTSFTLWINADNGSTATHKYEFMIENGVGVCYETEIATGTREKVPFTKSIDHECQFHSTTLTAIDGKMAMHTTNGKTYLEFMLPMDEFETVRDGYQYVVSVTHNGNSLFHPDNTNIGAGANTETLWLTHYNIEVGAGGGFIVNSAISAMQIDSDYCRRAYFVPSEYEGIYKMVYYHDSTAESKILSDEIAEVFADQGGVLPEGAFIYCIGSGNVANYVALYKKTVCGLNYNDIAMNKFAASFANTSGDVYVRFTGVDLETNRINTIYDDQWQTDVPFYEYGYGTDATYTIVAVDDVRDGNFPNQLKWESENAETITKVDRFKPEAITVDGDLSDTGWSENKWIEVIENQTGNIQNSGYNYCDEFGSYKYQIRTDGEYVYVAAVIDTPAEIGTFADTVNGTSTTKTATPAFRIWIQSQNSKYDGAVSFTHLFDVRPGSTTLSILTDSVNEEINKYNNHYLPVLDGAEHVGSSNNSGVAEGTKVTATVDANDDHTVNSGNLVYNAAIRAAENINGLFVPQGGLGGTVVEKTYGESVFFGETVFDAENLNTAVGYNDYQAGWFSKIDVENVIYGEECASYKAVGDQMQVEFRFALADIGCDDGSDFEYYVEARSQQEIEADSYILFYPPLPIESCVLDGDYARSYHFPYWVWGNNALTFDKEAAMLRNPMEPVSVLGAQSDNGYYDSQGIHGLKLGVLYKQEYLDKVHNDGATYWDVKDIGMLVALSNRLTLNGNDTALYIGTSGAANVPSDQIQDHVGNSNMADYSSYVFYSYVKIPESMEATDITYRGYVEYYASDDIYYDHPWLTGGVSEDGKDGWTYRPTYYSDTVTRNYNLVAGITDGDDGSGEEVLPDPDPITIPVNVVKTLTNAGGEIYSAGCSGFRFALANSSNGIEVLSCVSDVNGNATATLTFNKDDIDKTYNYILTETNDGVAGMTYSDSKYYITVKIGYDGTNNKLTYTLTNNSASVTEINATFGNTYDYTLDNGTKVVYVPLDNRPVNIDRAQYLAQAAGIELIVPPVEYFSNTLDNDADTTTNASDAGNPADILNWIKTDPDVQQANNFVLSLDMMFSGGLVGSRDPFYDSAYAGNTDSVASLGENNTLLENGEYVLSEAEKEIANYIIGLAGEKNVFLFDTVMRLATTGNYGNATDSAYGDFRDAYADAERPILSGDDLTIDNIVANYDKFIDGTTVVESGSDVIVTPSGGTAVSIDAEYKQLYNLARERKLRLIDYLVKNKDLDGDGVDDIDYDVLDKLSGMYIGVDDSKDNNNMQLNERNYITNVLFADSNALLFEGADELGLVGLSDCVTNLHGDINVRVEYFGSGKDWTADAYGYGTLDECIDKHVTASGAHEVTSGADMDILVLTRVSEGLYSGSSDADVTSLITKLKSNLNAGVPTCIIDGSGYSGYGRLADAILALADEGYDIANVLGFSAWNTTGNATGIAMANAIARCSYLKNVTNITDTSHYGFLKAIAYSYIKDDVYKKHIAECYASASAFYNYADEWLAGINESTVLTKITNGVGTSTDVGEVRVSNLNFPWNRNFEADFDVTVVASNNTANQLTTLTRNTATGAANYATFSAGDWWWGRESGTNDTADDNNPPWAQWFYNSAGLTDGVTYTEFGDKTEARTKWYGMAYRGDVTNDSTPETNAAGGVCNIPSIKFKEAISLDQLKMHFLYYKGGAVYLPEKVVVKLLDADGNLIATITETDIRKAEDTAVADGATFWLNMTFDKVYENVSTITIRPYIIHRPSDSYPNLYGWCLMDEIEVYTASDVLNADGSAN